MNKIAITVAVIFLFSGCARLKNKKQLQKQITILHQAVEGYQEYKKESDMNIIKCMFEGSKIQSILISCGKEHDILTEELKECLNPK